MNNLINPLALSKVLNKYNLTPQNKQQVVLFSKRKTTLCSTTHIFARKIKFKQLVVEQQQNQLH